MLKKLKKDVNSGVKWTAISSVLIAILNFLLLALLARMLNKSDFGLMAIVSIITIFSIEIVDMGLGQAIIQKQQTSDRQLSSLFWINTCIGFLVFIIINILAVGIAQFYKEIELISLIRIVSVVFITNGISTQYRALFQRDFKFKFLALVDLIGFGIYFTLTLSLAYLGFGVYALVWGTIGRSVLTGLIVFFRGLRIHIPKFIFKVSEVKEYLNFGAFRLGAFILQYINKTLDVLLIGSLVGMSALGIYDMYQRILEQPIRIFSPIVNRVALPMFAKIKEDKQSSEIIYVKVSNYLNTLRFPIFIFLFVMAAPVIRIVLGEDWLEEALVFRLLALLFMFRTVGALMGTFMVASGKANWTFFIGLIMIIITPAAIFIGSNYGMIGIVSALLIIVLLAVIPRFYFVLKKIIPNIKGTDYNKSILMPLIYAIIAGSAAALPLALNLNTIVTLVLGTIVFWSIYIVLTHLFNSAASLAVQDIFKSFFAKRKNQL
jgi:O-antigen/teichoic acid export membrane protein